jgi:hypothetical protein
MNEHDPDCWCVVAALAEVDQLAKLAAEGAP